MGLWAVTMARHAASDTWNRCKMGSCAGRDLVRQSVGRKTLGGGIRPLNAGSMDGVDATVQFQERLDRVAKDTEGVLDRLLASQPPREEIGRPARLLEAMRYASLGAG